MHLVPPPGNGRSQLASRSSRGLRAPKRARRFSAFAVLGGGESLRRIRRVASCALSVSASRLGAGGGIELLDLVELDRRQHVPTHEAEHRVDRRLLGVAFADAAELNTASGEPARASTNDHMNQAGQPPAQCLGCVRWRCALAALGQRRELVGLDHAERYPRV